MPNTQPLTPGRKLVALIVLFGCFLASVGVAQLLVYHRSKGFVSPPEMNEPPPSRRFVFSVVGIPREFKEITVRDSRVMTARRATLDGQPRDLRVYMFPDTSGIQQSDQFGRALFEDITRAAPADAKPAFIAGVRGVEYSAESADSSQFVWLRVTRVEGRAIAILYSGTLPISDADEELFAKVCETGIVIRVK